MGEACCSSGLPKHDICSTDERRTLNLEAMDAKAVIASGNNSGAATETGVDSARSMVRTSSASFQSAAAVRMAARSNE